MPTGACPLVLVHAHPDDETIATGGTIARYGAAGVRVGLVTCTLGEQGESIPVEYRGLTAARADQLGGYRLAELRSAAALLGVSELRLLGGIGRWRDSGMETLPGGRATVPDDLHPRALAGGPTDTQTDQLAAVLTELAPRVVVTYGPDGGYGHPDHVRVHELTMAAARRVPTVARVFWTVLGRSAMEGGLAALRGTTGLPFPLPPDGLPAVPDEEVGTVVDIAAVRPAKLAAMRAHVTQIRVWDESDPPAMALDDGMARPVLDVEQYTLAVGPATGAAHDLFGGLG